MKKQVLYFVAGMFLSLSIVAFFAFKKDKVDAGGGYAVVDYTCTVGYNTSTYSHPEGKTEETKNKSKLYTENYAQILNEMETKGYNFVENNLETNGHGTIGAVIIFKKK